MNKITASSHMTKQDRKEMIGRSMCGRVEDDRYRWVVTPGVLHDNLELLGATFTKKTTRRLLEEMVEEGDATKISRGKYRLTPDGAEKYCNSPDSET